MLSVPCIVRVNTSETGCSVVRTELYHRETSRSRPCLRLRLFSDQLEAMHSSASVRFEGAYFAFVHSNGKHASAYRSYSLLDRQAQLWTEEN